MTFRIICLNFITLEGSAGIAGALFTPDDRRDQGSARPQAFAFGYLYHPIGLESAWDLRASGGSRTPKRRIIGKDKGINFPVQLICRIPVLPFYGMQRLKVPLE